MSCGPTRVTGFRLVIGSWKIIDTVEPRTARISGTDNLSSSLPASDSRLADTCPGRGTSLITDRAVIDLPQPDSPTSANTSPASIENETPSTTGTLPVRDGKLVTRPSTSSRALN